MRFLALFLLFCTTAHAEELPENFSSLPWTEKTATKYEGNIEPRQVRGYFEASLVDTEEGGKVLDFPSTVFAYEEVEPGIYKVSYPLQDYSERSKDIKYKGDNYKPKEVEKTVDEFLEVDI